MPWPALAPSTAAADPVADFYRGKSIGMIVATAPGGDYDLRARLVARHIGRHIPGNPAIVPRNMPGGVGIQAANYMATVAAQDGTSLHAIMQNMSSHQALGGAGVEFDTRKFFWIGNTTDTPNTIMSWHTTGIRRSRTPWCASWSSARPARRPPRCTIRSVERTGRDEVQDRDRLSGRQPGQPGDGARRGRRPHQFLGLVEGDQADWLREKKIFMIVQIALKRDPELADVPTVIELAKTEEDKAVMTFLSADIPISRAYVTTPGVPAERVQALRRAFDATMKDPQFIAEAAKLGMDMSPRPARRRRHTPT